MKLVDLNGRVDLSNEEVGCIKTNRAGQQPKRKHKQSCVSKVQQRGNKLCDLKLKNSKVFAANQSNRNNKKPW